MSTTDKRTRDTAIPFEAYSFSTSAHGDAGELDAGLIRSSTLTVPIRCATPDRVELIEAHLNLILNVHSATTVKVAIGRFNSDMITVATLTQDEIDRSHRKITGTDTAIASSGGVLFIDGINILPAIPKRGDANFNPDGFVVVLQFSRARTSTNDVYRRFDVMCSAQMGLL